MIYSYTDSQLNNQMGAQLAVQTLRAVAHKHHRDAVVLAKEVEPLVLENWFNLSMGLREQVLTAGHLMAMYAEGGIGQTEGQMCVEELNAILDNVRAEIANINK